MDVEDGKERHHKSRFARKLFGKEKPTVIQTEADVSAFLNPSPSDKLHMTIPSPTADPAYSTPALQKLGSSPAHRWPRPADVMNLQKTQSASPKQSRKGLAVRFTDTQPEVIGEGGDEAESPTADISLRKRAATHPAGAHGRIDYREGPRDTHGTQQDFGRPLQTDHDFRPGPPRRTQTGAESLLRSSESQPIAADQELEIPYREDKPPAQLTEAAAARTEAEMRASEGQAFMRASGHFTTQDEERPSSVGSIYSAASALDEVQLNTMKNAHLVSSSGLPASLSAGRPLTPTTREESSASAVEPDQAYSPVAENPMSASAPNSPKLVKRTPTMQDAVTAVGDDSMGAFSTRIANMFTLFRLSAEAVRPISLCSMDELIRAALWWFLKGRMNLESTVRDRPSTPESQRLNIFKRQQAYADLAKSLWLVDKIAPLSPDMQDQHSQNPHTADVFATRQAVMSGLRKLAMSMQRNSFLPPDYSQASLPLGLDTSIWVADDGNRSLVSLQKPNTSLLLSDALPLGDSISTYTFGRLYADTLLSEDGEPQPYHCSCLVSIVRGVHEKRMRLVIANQTGTLKLCIQDDRSFGPTWDDVSWLGSSSTLDLKLPRGFKLRLQCGQNDFRNLKGLYDFQNKLYSTLVPREDEDVVFETTAKSFQCFAQDPQSQSFPVEAVSKCQVKLFEKTTTLKAATGPRRLHRGFRISVVTGTRTKNLRGINQQLRPEVAIQFGFLRGEGGSPALLLKTDEGKLGVQMVFTFDEVDERTRLHALLTASFLRSNEMVFAEIPINSFGITNPNDRTYHLNNLDWQRIRVINEDADDLQSTKTVLSENLRVVMEFQSGTFTDRLNIGPEELKHRLDINNLHEIKVLRQPQEDMTLLVSQQTAVQAPTIYGNALAAAAKTKTIRTYVFPSLQDLHAFQAAITGFVVLFDGTATSFNISRRRMVVPIYKKWDAATTRLQLVQKDKIVQLVAFFENFSHGDSMGFTLKSTDIFETSSRSGKNSLRIVDAKFAMPKPRDGADALVESGFLNLDMPDYPGEHDDITIHFETADERDRFAKALPAPSKVASRMASVRR